MRRRARRSQGGVERRTCSAAEESTPPASGLRFFEPADFAGNWMYFYYRIPGDNASQTTRPDFEFADKHFEEVRITCGISRKGLAYAGGAVPSRSMRVEPA